MLALVNLREGWGNDKTIKPVLISFILVSNFKARLWGSGLDMTKEVIG